MRQFEPEELEAIALANPHTGDFNRLARRFRRPIQVLYAKGRQLRDARLARARCSAFLPDNGIPYRAVVYRLWQASGLK
jgi:hypothetical protein